MVDDIKYGTKRSMVMNMKCCGLRSVRFLALT